MDMDMDWEGPPPRPGEGGAPVHRGMPPQPRVPLWDAAPKPQLSSHPESLRRGPPPTRDSGASLPPPPGMPALVHPHQQQQSGPVELPAAPSLLSLLLNGGATWSTAAAVLTGGSTSSASASLPDEALVFSSLIDARQAAGRGSAPAALVLGDEEGGYSGGGSRGPLPGALRQAVMDLVVEVSGCSGVPGITRALHHQPWRPFHTE